MVGPDANDAPIADYRFGIRLTEDQHACARSRKGHHPRLICGSVVQLPRTDNQDIGPAEPQACRIINPFVLDASLVK